MPHTFVFSGEAGVRVRRESRARTRRCGSACCARRSMTSCWWPASRSDWRSRLRAAGRERRAACRLARHRIAWWSGGTGVAGTKGDRWLRRCRRCPAQTGAPEGTAATAARRIRGHAAGSRDRTARQPVPRGHCRGAESWGAGGTGGPGVLVERVAREPGGFGRRQPSLPGRGGCAPGQAGSAGPTVAKEVRGADHRWSPRRPGKFRRAGAAGAGLAARAAAAAPVGHRHVRSYDVIIVGAGHNGLVTAAYLAARASACWVLERRHLVGGAC